MAMYILEADAVPKLVNDNNLSQLCLQNIDDILNSFLPRVYFR